LRNDGTEAVFLSKDLYATVKARTVDSSDPEIAEPDPEPSPG
jgi:hypothetical protein